jgi:hypothetical protein
VCVCVCVQGGDGGGERGEASGVFETFGLR